jgi:hypothetical protein
MQEPCTEGLATHGGPESCVVVCEGDGEALTGVRVGRAIEPRNKRFGALTSYNRAEGNIVDSGIRELSGGPARSENLCMRGTCMRENREIPCSPVAAIGWRAAQGRPRSYA